MSAARRAAERWGVPLALALGGCGDPESAPPAADELLRADRRIAELLQPCATNGFYDRDLADLVPVLVEKLERARPDPLKRAKEELGVQGSAAFPVLGNFFQRNYSDLMRSAFLENAVDALGFNVTEESHELLLQALLHPQESVRAKALDGLKRHAEPRDFDTLVQRLPIETRELRRQMVGVLFSADVGRAEDFFLERLAGGEERDLWSLAAPRLPETTREATGRRCAELFGGLEPGLAVHLAAAGARFGADGALEFLRGELRSESPERRLAAVVACTRATLSGELEYSLLEDPHDEVRALAVTGVGSAGELTEEQRSWLRAALDDPAPTVQAEALELLCERGDEEGLARALVQLDGGSAELQAALLALRGPLRRDAGLAERALERLLQRHVLEEHRPVQQRTATFKAIGQVPLRAAAQFLRRVGIAAGDERIESLRAHDWLMIQAANTALEGRRFLGEELAREEHALRRLDLIDALGSERDDLARAALLAVAEDARLAALERLFAASCLVKIGPSWEVAPRLKRVAFGMQAEQELEARTALQCLLWFWF